MGENKLDTKHKNNNWITSSAAVISALIALLAWIFSVIQFQKNQKFNNEQFIKDSILFEKQLTVMQLQFIENNKLVEKQYSLNKEDFKLKLGEKTNNRIKALENLKITDYNIYSSFPPQGINSLCHFDRDFKIKWLQKNLELMKKEIGNPILLESDTCSFNWSISIQSIQFALEVFEKGPISYEDSALTFAANNIFKTHTRVSLLTGVWKRAK